METTPLTASMADMPAGMSVSTHHVSDPGHLPPRLVLASLKLVDTTDDQAYVGNKLQWDL